MTRRAEGPVPRRAAPSVAALLVLFGPSLIWSSVCLGRSWVAGQARERVWQKPPFQPHTGLVHPTSHLREPLSPGGGALNSTGQLGALEGLSCFQTQSSHIKVPCSKGTPLSPTPNTPLTLGDRKHRTAGRAHAYISPPSSSPLRWEGLDKGGWWQDAEATPPRNQMETKADSWEVWR